MAENNNLLTYVLLAGVGYVGYRMYQKNKVAQAAAMPPAMQLTSDSLPPTNPIPGGPATVPVPSQLLPVAAVPTSANGIDPTVYQTVQQWAQEDNRAPVLRMAAAGIPAEYAGMYDIITNFWDKGIKVMAGSPQETFWNNLRNKYDPAHVLW